MKKFLGYLGSAWLIAAIFVAYMAQSAPDPIQDSVTGKTWLEDRDRLRAQWLNGQFQALFNWANGNITNANIATSAAISLSKIASGSSIPFSNIDYTNGLRREIQIASAGQTVFTLTNAYAPGQNRVEVFIGGIRQTANDFTETASKTVTMDEPLLAGLQVEFVLH